ncbi:MAG: hypothetical protein KF781_08605 [Chitinophagaceae bacterium]|nr:hypothetical protein [Chitinophagaceae bacterium]
MIPIKIKALFEFIDFLDKNKENYKTNYLPLIKELEILGNKRSELKPIDNYSKKQEYDVIQKQIEEKFPTITENIYKPITNKLLELEIWTGDDAFSSIWNGNIEAISQFKNDFESADVELVMNYKIKYLNFRIETHNNFLCLGLIFQELDEIFKELFDFFKDTNENEFKSFEAKELKVSSVEELINSISENNNRNIKYSLPIESFMEKKEQPNNTNSFIFNNYETTLGDKIIAENIPNNSGVINIASKNKKNEQNPKDNLAIKSFNWQKFGIISATILAIVAIIVAIIYS